MKKTLLAVLVLALLSTACLAETFDDRTGTGLGPDVVWEQAAISSGDHWSTRDDHAFFEVDADVDGYEIFEDMQFATPALATGDQKAAVQVVDHDWDGAGHVWSSVILGVRVDDAGEGYRGYVAELARGNYLNIGQTPSSPFYVLVLYRSEYGPPYSEHMYTSVQVFPDFSSPLAFTLEVDGSSLTTSFAGKTLHVDDACAAEAGRVPPCYTDGSPALYGFLGRDGDGAATIEVDNFTAFDL